MNKKWHYFKCKEDYYKLYNLWRYTKIKHDHYIELYHYNRSHDKWIRDYNNDIHIKDIQITYIEAFQIICDSKVL